MTQNEIYTAILSGDADDGLDRIVQAVSERRKALASTTFHELHPHDVVQVVMGNARPRYLDGAFATVIEKRITKITVKFPDEMPHSMDPYKKYRGKKFIFPPSLLRKAEVEA